MYRCSYPIAHVHQEAAASCGLGDNNGEESMDAQLQPAAIRLRGAIRLMRTAPASFFIINRIVSLRKSNLWKGPTRGKPNGGRHQMPGDDYYERPLFGGAISSCFPLRFQDLSEVREVPDHQEAFVDSSHDESLVFELLDFKSEVEDNTSAVWFLQDIAREQDAKGSVVHEHSGNIEAAGLQNRNVPVVYTTAVGQMAISKGRQLREAQNVVRVYLANLRLKEVGTDVLITAYEPILINPLSESARMASADATASGCLPVAEVFKLAVTSFKVHDWNLFGAGA